MFSMVNAPNYSKTVPKSVSYITVNEASSSYDLEVSS